jgi:hypothetical protein
MSLYVHESSGERVHATAATIACHGNNKDKWERKEGSLVYSDQRRRQLRRIWLRDLLTYMTETCG